MIRWCQRYDVGVDGVSRNNDGVGQRAGYDGMVMVYAVRVDSTV